MVTADLAMDASENGSVPAPLSAGAGRALGSVLSRLLDGKPAKRARSAPGLGLVLGADEELAEVAASEATDRVRDRDAKRARLAFEALARVVPDAATGAQTERQLRETATRGVVALFNAVSKAQKGAVPEEVPGKKKSTAVSKEGFMNLLREGVAKGAPHGETGDGGDGVEGMHRDVESSGEEGRPRASWMQDDYMTKGSRKLKDWTRDGASKSADKDSDCSSPDVSDASDESEGSSFSHSDQEDELESEED